MHAKSDNIEFMSYDNANDIVDELFELLHSRYQGNLETTMEGGYFVFDSVQLLYNEYRRINFRRVCPYIDSPDWIKKKKSTINPKKKR